uniref:Uncharacterized protein n=1 Tax=Peronospora matthiolae TaxID=2874970 RepID=A0AAV1U6K6_9STRA
MEERKMAAAVTERATSRRRDKRTGPAALRSVRQEKQAESEKFVSTAFELDPRNFGKTVCISKRPESQKGVQEEISALQINDVWRVMNAAQAQTPSL